MKTYKNILSAVSAHSFLRALTPDESQKLRAVYLKAYQDLAACCEKHGLTVMLIGGSALGAVRHKGFIPWDDDLDVAMPRNDFEKLKTIFDGELGEKYALASPNYRNTAKNRFPMMLVKGTRFMEIETMPDDPTANIKLDIFLIDNVPSSPVLRYMKGAWCSALMFISSHVDAYEKRSEIQEKYVSQIRGGRESYLRRIRIGKLLSFRNGQQWFNSVDKAFQYPKETDLMGIPSGRKHYFGEIIPAKSFIPASKGEFEGMTVNLPGNPDDYLRNLYGSDYMTLPPENKRERHFFVDIQFKGENDG